MINTARPGANAADATNHILALSGGSNECVSYVRERVCVRGLINVESNAARDTHTP